MAEHTSEEKRISDDCRVCGVEFGHQHKNYCCMLNPLTYIDEYTSDTLICIENRISSVDLIDKFNTLESEMEQERTLFIDEERRLKKELYYYQFLVQLEGDYDLLKDCVSRT